MFDTGQCRRTDPVDAHHVAVAALRSKGLRQVVVDDETVALRLLVDGRDGLGRDHTDLLTLAEELHFGRTAQRLHVSQARVSQAIKAQERRTSRAVTLTPVGLRLRDDLRTGYDAIQQGIATASASARGTTGTVRLGVTGAVGHEIRDVIDRFTGRHPGCEVVLREIHLGDPFGPLRARDVDLVVVWRPVREADLTEGQVVLVEGCCWPWGRARTRGPGVGVAGGSGRPRRRRPRAARAGLLDRVGAARPGAQRSARPARSRRLDIPRAAPRGGGRSRHLRDDRALRARLRVSQAVPAQAVHDCR
ncbi:LysR substrate-binding domain-containing protein [Actinoplanes sp. CA-142083]|uniref:LysR family transcriptional regulator n=1 Tax=Actinoplanes sp. CA-142083 TaxID=3239903 RepID=UPI003D8E1467